MKHNFIKTTDENTRKTLIRQGFQEIPSAESGTYVFLNCNKLQFSSDVDKSKMCLTNTFCV